MFLRTKINAFTLVETIMVVLILAVAAIVAVPLISSASSMQLRAAANIIASDLEYAKTLAIGHQKYYFMEFDKVNEVYRLYDKEMNLVTREDLPGRNFVVDFKNSSKLDSIDIQNVSFDASSIVTFDYLGAPYSGRGLDYPLNQGTIIIKADSSQATITVEPVTGYVTVTYQ